MKTPPASQPEPAHDWNKSQAVTPYRHEKSGRTVGRFQDAGNGVDTHLFSATGSFIETVKTTAVAGKLKKAEEPAAASVPPPAQS